LKRETIHTTISYYCLIAIAFTLPLTININSFFIILLSANWILEGNYKAKIKLLVSNKLSMGFIVLFGLYLLGLIYTDNTEMGIFNLKKKLSLLLLPLIIPTIDLENKKINSILYSFVAACVVAVLICFGHASFKYIQSGTSEYFHYHNFSKIINIHAVYFSFYLLFSSVILIKHFIQMKTITGSTFLNKILPLIALAAFLSAIYVLSSKLFLALTILTLLIFIIDWYRQKKMIFKGILYSLIFIVGSSTLILYSSFNRNRINEIITTDLHVIGQSQFKYDTPFTGISLRIVLGKLSLEAISQHHLWLFGSGTGDGQDLLNEKIKEHNLYTGNPTLNDKGYLGYNVHCQYIETLLYTGIGGLLALIFIIFVSMKAALRKKESIYAFLMIAISIFFLTESVLELHKGIVFFTFFNCLLFSNNISETDLNSKPFC